jgi:hypothetical protein
VTVRGFNQQIANKLLLVDGRSVTRRAFSGVYWDMQNLMPRISSASKSSAAPEPPCEDRMRSMA